ncbi:MAG: hypothetical protein HYU83_02780 [Chloroflexi bacterium]|nr:hypothetical protein [Chloroflexota bacterium]
MWGDRIFRAAIYGIILYIVCFFLIILAFVSIIIGGSEWKYCGVFAFIFGKFADMSYKQFSIMKVEEFLQHFYNCPIEELKELIELYYENAVKDDPRYYEDWLKVRALVWRILQQRLENKSNGETRGD